MDTNGKQDLGWDRFASGRRRSDVGRYADLRKLAGAGQPGPDFRGIRAWDPLRGEPCGSSDVYPIDAEIRVRRLNHGWESRVEILSPFHCCLQDGHSYTFAVGTFLNLLDSQSSSI